MSVRVRAGPRAPLAGVALGPPAPLAATAPASAGAIGQIGGAGFAVVTAAQASRPQTSFFDLPSNQYASSSLGKVGVARAAKGAYIVMFRGVLGRHRCAHRRVLLRRRRQPGRRRVRGDVQLASRPRAPATGQP